MIKNAEGEAEVIRQYGVRVESSRWAPRWQVVQPAAPVQVTFAQQPEEELPARDSKVAVILPDTQIGYRWYNDTEEYDPFHDVKALDVALQITRDINPDRVVLLGDLLDMPNFGKYEQEATFARTTQKALDYAYQFLVLLSVAAPNAIIELLEGNHDRRLEKMVTKNAMEAFGLRRADDTDGWPVLSVPHLLRLDELGVRYIGGYPAGTLWINDRLKCVHGDKVRSSGSTAKAVVDDERVSTIFGHVHRIETHYRTANVHGGGRTRLAHTPGCLCRIDGAVPSVHGSTTLDGRPVERYEDWQQGLTVVHYQDGDGPFALETVFIDTFEGYRASYGGYEYTPE
jgi:hypothetical protein